MRTPLSSRRRFEALKRDGFACQYCGRRAPNVVLHVDHIVPVSAGGSDDLDNFICACMTCNLGKHVSEVIEDSPDEWGPGRIFIMADTERDVALVLLALVTGIPLARLFAGGPYTDEENAQTQIAAERISAAPITIKTRDEDA